MRGDIIALVGQCRCIVSKHRNIPAGALQHSKYQTKRVQMETGPYQSLFATQMLRGTDSKASSKSTKASSKSRLEASGDARQDSPKARSSIGLTSHCTQSTLSTKLVDHASLKLSASASPIFLLVHLYLYLDRLFHSLSTYVHRDI